jgi:hypothetical protein
VQRNFEDVVVEKKGFKWVNERPDAKTENDEKWGWIGGKPGDYVVLGLDSRSSGDGAGAGASVGAFFWRACQACGSSCGQPQNGFRLGRRSPACSALGQSGASAV